MAGLFYLIHNNLFYRALLIPHKKNPAEQDLKNDFALMCDYNLAITTFSKA